MDDFYCVTVCRKSLVDSDIPLLEKTLNANLGISRQTFYQSFNATDELCFELNSCVDALQECLLLMEDQGFRVSAVKMKKNSEQIEGFPSGFLGNPNSLVDLTYEDCRPLLQHGSSSIHKWVRHKNWIVFGCSVTVISVYLLMIYSTFI